MDKDWIDKKKYEQYNSIVAKFSENTFNIKALYITSLTAIAAIVATLYEGNRNFNLPVLFFIGILISIFFYSLDIFTYYYQDIFQEKVYDMEKNTDSYFESSSKNLRFKSNRLYRSITNFSHFIYWMGIILFIFAYAHTKFKHKIIFKNIKNIMIIIINVLILSLIILGLVLFTTRFKHFLSSIIDFFKILHRKFSRSYILLNLDKGRILNENYIPFPLKKGHEFLYWYENNANKPFDFNQKIDRNLHLKAKWKKKETVEIKFNKGD